MKATSYARAGIIALVIGAWALPLRSQETVTVPKSRLEELERKEAELEKLKGHKEAGAPAASQAPAVSQGAANVRTSEPVRVTPPIANLPSLQQGEVVDGADLANHYHANLAAAEQRYGKQVLNVRGEVVGFDRQMFTRNYKILLKAGEAGGRVVCEMRPSDTFTAVFTAKSGSELVGSAGQGQVVLAKVGQVVVIQGRCKGLKDAAVVMSGCELVSVK